MKRATNKILSAIKERCEELDFTLQVETLIAEINNKNNKQMTTANTNSGDFLPPDYTTPETGSGGYMKLKDGDNPIRILSKPLMGWQYWSAETGKPVRLPNQKDKPHVDPKLIKEELGGKKPVKFFWAMVVWSYLEKKIMVLEITQNSIQTGIENLFRSEKWGSPFKYDITINKKGQKLDTEYAVIPSPPAPVPDEIKKGYTNTPVNLQVLMTGGDPFAKTVATEQQPVVEVKPVEIPKVQENDGLPF